MQRLKWIDTARGIGVILVVIGHISSINNGIGQWIYSFHMPLFFVISGILFSIKKEADKSFGVFVLSRVKGIIYPYLMISFLNIIYDLLLHGINHAVGYLIDTLTLNGILALWFLPALFIAELLLFCWIRIYRHHFIVALVFVIIALAITILFSGTDFQKYDGIYYYLISLCNTLCRTLTGFVFLLIGYLSFKVYHQSQLRQRFQAKTRYLVICTISVLALVISIILCRFNNVLLSNSIIGNPILFYINALCGTFGVIGLSYIFGNYLKLIPFYGINSMIIFSTHFNFGIISLARQIYRFEFIHGVVLFVIVMLIETVLAWAVSRYFSFIVSYKDLKNILCKIHVRKRSR